MTTFPLADPLTTENSSYGLGDNEEKEEFSKCRHNLKDVCMYVCRYIPVYLYTILAIEDCTFLFSTLHAIYSASSLKEYKCVSRCILREIVLIPLYW